jgi:hypothetical protein
MDRSHARWLARRRRDGDSYCGESWRRQAATPQSQAMADNLPDEAGGYAVATDDRTRW